jgi:hypothetical protein
VHARDDVAVRLVDAVVRRAIGVDERRAGHPRLVGVEDGREHVVGDVDEAARGIRRFGGLGDDRDDALADVAHDVVEHAGVVGVVGAVLVAAR